MGGIFEFPNTRRAGRLNPWTDIMDPAKLEHDEHGRTALKRKGLF
jgi:hypothetical protein